MRYLIVGVICAVIGVTLTALLGWPGVAVTAVVAALIGWVAGSL